MSLTRFLVAFREDSWLLVPDGPGYHAAWVQVSHGVDLDLSSSPELVVLMRCLLMGLMLPYCGFLCGLACHVVHPSVASM